MTLLQRDRENREEGREAILISLYQDGILSKDICARKLNMAVEDFENLIEKNK